MYNLKAKSSCTSSRLKAHDKFQCQKLTQQLNVRSSSKFEKFEHFKLLKMFIKSLKFQNVDQRE